MGTKTATAETETPRVDPPGFMPVGKLFRKIVGLIKEGMDPKAAGEFVFDNYHKAERDRRSAAKQPSQSSMDF